MILSEEDTQGIFFISHAICILMAELHCVVTCVHAKSFHSCLTLCHLMDYSLPGSSVLGILKARILQRVTVPSSRCSSQTRD